MNRTPQIVVLLINCLDVKTKTKPLKLKVLHAVGYGPGNDRARISILMKFLWVFTKLFSYKRIHDRIAFNGKKQEQQQKNL